MRQMLTILLGISLLATAASVAQAGSLGVAGNYNEFIFSDSTRSNVSTQGQVAVGGNATFNNFTIGTAITNLNIYGTDTLIVGGALSGSQANLNGYGNAKYGSRSINKISYNGGGTGSVGSDPSFFSDAESYLKRESIYLAGLDANGTTTTAWGGITLTGTDATLDVFNLSGAALSKANSLRIDAPSTATIVVNIDGDSDSMKNFGFTLMPGVDASNILYNFSTATSLSLSGINIQGSVLAPFAAVNFGNGQLNGNLIAYSLTGSGTTLNHRFAGNLPTLIQTPEPSSMAMVLIGCTLAALPSIRNRLKQRTGISSNQPREA
jgi:choice-of-anchor A domain-containing protein